jgi:hypothetical protein
MAGNRDLDDDRLISASAFHRATTVGQLGFAGRYPETIPRNSHSQAASCLATSHPRTMKDSNLARLFMRLAGLMIAVGQALDVATTKAALASGGAELNPLMRLSMVKLGSLWWLPKAAIAGFILVYVFSKRTPPTRRVVALAAIALAVTIIVIANNLAQLANG